LADAECQRRGVLGVKRRSWVSAASGTRHLAGDIFNLMVLVAIGIGVFFLAHTAPFPFLLEAFAPSRSIWHLPDTPGRDGRPLVYLTYDDGPNPAATPALLDALRDADAHATFFLIDAHLTDATALIVRGRTRGRPALGHDRPY
jgi:hypothetical protein